MNNPSRRRLDANFVAHQKELPLKLKGLYSGADLHRVFWAVRRVSFAKCSVFFEEQQNYTHFSVLGVILSAAGGRTAAKTAGNKD
jgi:hypothetical protein